jgi:hypothetical protein
MPVDADGQATLAFAAIAMFPPIRRRGANIFCSVRPGSGDQVANAARELVVRHDGFAAMDAGRKQAIPPVASEDDSGLGFKFWPGLAGVVVATASAR